MTNTNTTLEEAAAICQRIVDRDAEFKAVYARLNSPEATIEDHMALARLNNEVIHDKAPGTGTPRDTANGG